MQSNALLSFLRLLRPRGSVRAGMVGTTALALSFPATVHAQVDISQILQQVLGDARQRREARAACDSAMVVIAAGDRRRIPIVACSTTSADSLALRRAVTAVTNALSVYSRLTGVPYPWPQYEMEVRPATSMLQIKGQSQGPGKMTFAGPLPGARTERDRPDVTAKILVHELAHQWFTEYVTPEGHSGWLFEGFADFMTGQAWAAAQGARAEEEFLFFYNAAWSQVNRKSPASRVDRTLGSYAPTGLYSLPWPGATIWVGTLDSDNDLYYRGALTLWMLQRYLGDARFWAAVKTYVTANAHKAAGTTEFLQAIRTATGEDLGWFFDQWVHGSGYPQVTVSAAYDATTHRVTLHVAQAGSQATPVFRLPVTIRIGTAQGDVVTHAVLDSARQTIVVNDVRRAPTFVVFDDADAIVKTLRFDQPTPWLVTELERDATPWQTWWTIEQLRSRAATDPAAARALLAAVQRGLYPLTRAQAAVALGAVMTPAGLAALTHALQDTAVLVRRGALQALDAQRTPAAVALATAAFQHDPSDIVRFDALADLLRNPTVPVAEQRALFTDALRQSSYRDVVRLGAILSTVGPRQDCDSAKVAILRAMVTDPVVGQDVAGALTTINHGFLGLGPACLRAIAPSKSVPPSAQDLPK